MKKKSKTIILKLHILIVAAIAFTGSLEAQVTIGTGREANPSAMLEVVSDTSGLLLPRVKLVSTTNYSPLSAHVQGMTVYNTETANDVVPGQYYNDGTRWIRIQGTEDQQITTIVFVDNTDPNTATKFSTNTVTSGNFVHDPTLEKQTDMLYVDTNSSSWIYNGTEYIPYNSVSSTAWYLKGSNVDAGGNKTANISREGSVTIDVPSDKPVTSAVNVFNRSWEPVPSENNFTSRGLVAVSDPPAVTEDITDHNQQGVFARAFSQVAIGKRNNGYSAGIRIDGQRRSANNGGTLYNLYGAFTQYGHYTTNVSGTTERAIGMRIEPYALSGTIIDSYDIYADNYYKNISSGVTNKYGIYILGIEKTNYLQGTLGIGTNAPTEKLHVDGAIVVGTTANVTPTNGTIRFNGTNLQVYINGWKNVSVN